MEELRQKVTELYMVENKSATEISKELNIKLYKISKVINDLDLKNKKADYIKCNFEAIFESCNYSIESLAKKFRVNNAKAFDMINYYGFQDRVIYPRPINKDLYKIEEVLIRKLDCILKVSVNDMASIFSKNTLYIQTILNLCDEELYSDSLIFNNHKKEFNEIKKTLKISTRKALNFQEVEKIVLWYLYVNEGLLLGDISIIFNSSKKVISDKLSQYTIDSSLESFVLHKYERYKISSRKLADELNIPWFRIKAILKKHGCEGKYAKTYVSPTQQNKIIALYCKKKMSINKISQEMNIGYKIVRNVLTENNISVDYFWDSGKDSFLIDELGNMPLKKISKATGKTFSAIENRAYKLNIYSPLNATSYYLVSDVAASLNVSKATLYRHINQGKLKTKKMKITKNRFFNLIPSRDIWRWIKENMDLVDISKLPHDEFGVEPIWFSDLRKSS